MLKTEEVTVNLEDLRRVITAGYPDALESCNALWSFERIAQAAFPTPSSWEQWNQEWVEVHKRHEDDEHNEEWLF